MLGVFQKISFLNFYWIIFLASKSFLLKCPFLQVFSVFSMFLAVTTKSIPKDSADWSRKMSGDLWHTFFFNFFYFFSIFYNVFGIDGPQQMKELRGRFPTQCYVSCNACQATAACGAGTSHWTSLGPQRQPKTRVSHPVLALHRLHRALSFKAEDQLAAEDHRQPVQSYVWISNEQVILDHAYGRYHS